jgi:hypothetical protein
VALGYFQAARSLGDEWLILAVEFTSSGGSGRTIVDRSAIMVIAPDGRRLPLASQDEFREHFSEFRVTLERSLRSLPILGRYDRSQMPCDRWFLASPFGGFPFDEVPVSAFQVCSGPLVFRVSGGIQPGRWRMIIDLEESRVDLPFILEAD